MMRSMYSGVSGLKVHQTKMDVIGNNIANVNTVGFKSSSVRFSDILYQTTSNATGPNAQTGTAGTNAKQIGLGASVSSIMASMSTTGGSQRTDNALDVMIEGDSFFIVDNGNGNYFTRAGSFTVDAAGTLCTASGAKVMGWQPSLDNPTICERDNVSELKVMSPENLYAEPAATTDAYLSGNIDYNDEQLRGNGAVANVLFYDSLGNSYTAVLNIKMNEESLTDAIPCNFTLTLADVYDSSGKSMFAIQNEEDGTWAASDVFSAYLGLESGGEPGNATVDEETGKVTFDDMSVNIAFDSATGKFKTLSDGKVEADENIDEPVNSLIFRVGSSPDSATPFEQIAIDLSSITMFANSGTTSIESTRGNILTGSGTGNTSGNMTGLSIDSQGLIYGAYDNGDSKLLGQIAVANFANAAGLEAVGNNMYAQTRNSGEFDGIGVTIGSTGGKFTTGVLEMSNVDLASEFTDMITTQRGFQANSRIITTSDTLLEELINLKR